MKNIDIKFAQPTIRLAMPVPTTPELREKGKEQGIYFDSEGTKFPQDLSIAKAIKAAGLSKFRLPKIHYYNKEDIRTINGKKYLLVTLEPPKDYKRIPNDMAEFVVKNPDGKTGHYPGLIRAINLDSGETEAFTYDEVYDQIKGPGEEFSEKTRLETNEGIKKFNTNVAKIDLATASLNNLPLQLRSVKDQVDERILKLNDIIQGLTQQVEKEPQKPEALADWEKYIDQQIGSGSLEESDLTDHILAKYQYRYHDLAKDLESNNLVIPENIGDPEAYKQKLLTIVKIVLEQMKKEKDREEAKEKEKAARPPYDITNQPEITQIEELQTGKVPVKHKNTGYFSWESRGYSKGHGIEGSQKDKSELEKISSMLAQIGVEIGGLQKEDKWNESERTYKFLTTPEGQPIVEHFKKLCNEGLKGFTERYSKDMVDDQGRLDSRKFSRKGDMGNVGLVVAFTQIYQVLALVFEKASLPPPIKPTTVAIPGAEKEPTGLDGTKVPKDPVGANLNNKAVIKIAKSDWDKLGKK